MKFGWHQTINNTVDCYQTHFSIALILEQVSTYYIALRGKVNTKKAACRRKNNMISEENVVKTRMSATANEDVLNGLDDKNKDKDSKR